MVETDYYVRMGKTHTICQDYAVAGLSGGRPYALLSDGCSGSPVKGDPGSPHTDFGSRFLVRSASYHLGDLYDGIFPQDKIAIEAYGMVRQTGLPKASLDATLIALVQTGRYFRTYQTGDGVIAARLRDGKLKYHTIKFGENMPYYLGYTLDEWRRQVFLETAKTATVTTNTFEPGVGWGTPIERVEDLNDQFRLCQTRLFDTVEVEAVLILSDGAESFMKKGTTEDVPLEQVVEQVCAFKNYQGEFVSRRLNAFLDRHCVQEGWVHNDDFSCAGIYVPEPVVT